MIVISELLKKQKSITEYMSVQDAAEMFGVSQDTIYKFVKTGKAKAKKVGRKIFVDPDSLAEDIYIMKIQNIINVSYYGYIQVVDNMLLHRNINEIFCFGIL